MTARAGDHERLPAGNVSLPDPSVTPAPPAHEPVEGAPVPRWQIVLLVAATFGGGMAMIVPMAYSLAVRLDQLAPGRTDVLGYILGVGAAATLVLAPMTGILSDRTRTRWGRRRPFTVIGMVVGVAAVPVMSFAPDLLWLGIGWVLCTVGWGTAAGSVGNWQADRLPPGQRGSVSGLTGVTMQIAPVIGIIMVGPLRGDILLVFAVPAAVAVVLVGLFVLLAPEPDTRDVRFDSPLTVGALLRSYLFRPRDVPDFAWNWLGRFVFFLGLSLTTSFTVFFIAQRLAMPVADVAGVQALTSALSIGTAMLGSLGGGWISDRWRRRKPIILAGAALFAGGAVVSAFAHDLVMIIVGVLIGSLGIASFSAVGQALVLDVLPERETQAGRYMAITMFAQKIPGVLAPVTAPLLLMVGDSGQNFTLLYLTSAVLALIGGSIIASKVHGIR
ncbi:MFS transporter [Microbacterium sp. W1N]|uniref:MFS transporter n=1 Tax=Microbacterium festucae TaxID=2977531 RepID=UPI0021C0BEF4|nr:MFS transporter [Microbacterium festucae]MCT9821367.1 MFS transporter [Microbacterium festucae]